METISNIASTATTTVSNLIYGDQTKKNEPAAKEPVSGEQGKGTATDPFDHGNEPTPLATDKKAFIDDSNQTTSKESVPAKTTDTSSGSNDFLKLSPVVDGPQNEDGAPKIHTNSQDTTYTGMPIVPLNPDVAVSGVNVKSSTTTESTDTAGATDKKWEPTPFEDINRSGAPSAGPSAPDAAVKTEAPDSVTASTEIYSATSNTAPVAPEKDVTKVSADRDGSVSPKTNAPPAGAPADTHGFVAEKVTHKSEPGKSSPTSEEKSNKKMSHLKEKLKDKLHIGSKDK